MITKQFLYKLRLNKQQLDDLTLVLTHSLEEFKAQAPFSSSTEKYEHLKNHVLENAREYLPPNQRHPRTIIFRSHTFPPPWWNKECEVAVMDWRLAHLENTCLWRIMSDSLRRRRVVAEPRGGLKEESGGGLRLHSMGRFLSLRYGR